MEFDRFQNLIVTRPIAFFDLETTGLNARDNRIVEWSVLRVEPDKPPVQITKRCDPEMEIPSGASAIHGIYDWDVYGLGTFASQCSEMIEYMNGCVISGFNILYFDIGFVNAELDRIGSSYERIKPTNSIDVMRAYHALTPWRRGRTLSEAYRVYCGDTHSSAHGAAGDTVASARVLDSIVSRHSLPREMDRLVDRWK